jgi:hypothetical protein
LHPKLNPASFFLPKIKKALDTFSIHRCNESDEFDDFYDELDEDDAAADDDEGSNQGLKARMMMKSFSGQMLTSSVVESEPELNTPMDKRSRSLISLRRRHWSASSNRSSSAVYSCATAAAAPTRSNRFVNTDDRNGHRARRGEQVMPTQQQQQFRQQSVTSKSSATILVGQGHAKSKSLRNSSNLINNNRRSNLNTSVSALLGVGKLSRNLRKSFNDLYTVTANKLSQHQQQQQQQQPQQTTSSSSSSTTSSSRSNAKSNDEQDDLKENKSKCKLRTEPDENEQERAVNPTAAAAVDEDAEEQAAETSNKYTKRFKRLKNTLIKTKNSLFHRKQRTTAHCSSSELDKVSPKEPDEEEEEEALSMTTASSKTIKNLKRKSMSSPSLDKLAAVRGGGYSTTVPSKFDLELDANQSFVNNFRSRFLKRNRSSKLGEQHLNSTTITAKLSETNLSAAPTNTKRPKFY